MQNNKRRLEALEANHLVQNSDMDYWGKVEKCLTPSEINELDSFPNKVTEMSNNQLHRVIELHAKGEKILNAQKA